MGALHKVARGARHPASALQWLYGRLRSRPAAEPDGGTEYEHRIAAETEFYKDVTDINVLPGIFHYWSHTYLRPMFEEHGFSNPDEFFAKYLYESAMRVRAEAPAFVSIGAGNCDTEVRVARLLEERGLDDFVIECLDMNPHMLERGRAMAERENVAARIRTVPGDFNRWRAPRRYAGIMANQSLHHVLELEALFDEVKRALDPSGYFVASDIIGRNGHQRWPEALEEVQRFWRELPLGYRYNHQLARHEEAFQDWDCSGVGFEGVRAEDILRLLVERFDFRLFIGFGNVVDPFVDRSFGHNFNATAEWDRAFIDRVHAFDERALACGRLTPTHMLAVMTPGPSEQHAHSRGLSPEMSIRRGPPSVPSPIGESAPAPRKIHSAHPAGHFYSPVVDPAELEGREAELWPAMPTAAGIDFDPASHREILSTLFPRYLPLYDYPDEADEADASRFHTRNSQFSWLDARALFVLLNAWRPRRMIEVGSGFSSLLVADVNCRFLGGALDFTCIEPYPREFLRRGVEGIARVIEQKVQDVPLETFDALEAGDILFVDSSHVAKTGSDVNRLVFEVFPRLRRGVRIHIHDIFLPAEYPRDWVLDENRSWNEQYVVRALLMYSRAFRVLFGSSYAFHCLRDNVCKALGLVPETVYGGASLWIEKIE